MEPNKKKKGEGEGVGEGIGQEVGEGDECDKVGGLWERQENWDSK